MEEISMDGLSIMKGIINCDKRIKAEKRSSLKTKIPVIIFSLIFLFLLLNVSFNFTPTFIGFLIQEEKQTFTQTLDLQFTESTDHEWNLENIGQLTSLKLSGDIEGKGNVKIYLDDLLILQSSEIKTGITGSVVEGVEEDYTPIEYFLGFFQKSFSAVTGNVADEETSNSETNEEGSQEDSSPSQEPSSSEITEEVKEKKEKKEPKEKKEKREKIISSKDIVEINLGEGAIHGFWTATVKYQDVETNEVFTVDIEELAKFEIHDNMLTITNIGNTRYTKTVQIVIGDTVGIKEPKLDVGESIEFRLIAPEGSYDVRVSDGVSSIERGGVSLTGKVVGILDERVVGSNTLTGGIKPENDFSLTYLKGNKFVYVFILVIFGATILLAIERNYRRKVKV
tara:strand:+ start:33 stop:1220 length:1188 start_codon:yes stop_codon:yes gene_type:complete